MKNSTRKLAFVTALASMLLASKALAEDFHEIRDVSADAEISIFNTSGDIEIEGWSKKQVEIVGDLGENVEEIVFEVDGRSVLIEVRIPSSGSRQSSADLLIKVPVGSSLDVSAVSADISVENVNGRQQLNTVSGDVESTVADGDIIAESVSGDVDISGADMKNRTRATSVSGDVEVERLDGEIEISTVSGDLGIEECRFETVDAQTVNGDINFHAGLYGESRMHIETVNGEIDLLFSEDVSAHFDIETFNGDIRNCFGPEPERTSEYTPGSELKFAEGGGKGKVVVRTLNGDLTICKD